MPELTALAKLTIFVGLSVTIIGILMFFFDKVPFLWRLPGDINIQRKSLSFYFPITSCLLISAILSIVFYFLSRK
ncbi:MAG: DUF2905 domain-containing protein [Candidatus Omnitrophica bacterium]|nr:DUF2905 domain-containing protein [Candidatus Omnitrophota bacterium]